MRQAPGNPLEGERNLPPHVLETLKKKYDFTLTEYLSGILLHGDLRYSFQHRDKKVWDILKQGLPYSLELGAWALLVSIFFGLIWGGLAALTAEPKASNLIMATSMVGIAIPNFVLGPLFQWIFSLELQWTPVAGWSGFSSKVLPVITLSLMYIAYIARISRGSFLESITKDYIKTAKAKGLSSIHIFWKHILRNSLVPIVNFLGPATAALLTGTLVVEKIFNIPGIGRYFVESALQRDFPVALGVVITYSCLLLLLNLLTDIIQSIIDPRIEFS
jgi:oligopeptide transport system permease protein